jgi:hypothetical protein
MDDEVSALANGLIRGVAALIAGVVKDNLYLEECLVDWLIATDGDASLLPLGARRAAIAVLAADEGKFELHFKAAEAPLESVCCFYSCRRSLRGLSLFS